MENIQEGVLELCTLNTKSEYFALLWAQFNEAGFHTSALLNCTEKTKQYVETHCPLVANGGRHQLVVFQLFGTRIPFAHPRQSTMQCLCSSCQYIHANGQLFKKINGTVFSCLSSALFSQSSHQFHSVFLRHYPEVDCCFHDWTQSSWTSESSMLSNFCKQNYSFSFFGMKRDVKVHC